MKTTQTEILQLEEHLMDMLQANRSEWDTILSLIACVEERSLYRDLGHPTLSSWLRKIGIFSRLKGGEFRYDPRTYQNQYAG
jgi:hypothetical protein